MFKQQNNFWLYFFGLIVMFIIIFFIFQAVTERGIFARKPNSVNNVAPTKKITQFTNQINVTSSAGSTQSNSSGFDLTRDYFAEVETNYGTINLELFEKNAPNTVANFINLANSKYYDETKFFKLIPGVILQGGSDKTKNSDPTDDALGNSGYTIPDEVNWDSLDYPQELRKNLSYQGYKSARVIASKEIEQYSLVMANPKPNSASSQFMIILADAGDSDIQKLRGRVTVFAQIKTESKSIIQRLASLPIDASLSSPRPLDDIIIKSVKIYSK